MLPTPNLAIWKARLIARRLSRTWTPVTWLPRFSSTPFAELDIFADYENQGTPIGPEPHDAIANGIATCPVCWDSVALRSNNPNCPTCYGTGWNGGYNAARPLTMYITEAELSILPTIEQERVSMPQLSAMFLATTLVLPQDLIYVNTTRLRYRVGNDVQTAGLQPPIVARMVTLYSLYPSDVTRNIVISPVWTS